MRAKIFTHTDLDGVGCGVVLSVTTNFTESDLVFCNYDDIDDKVQSFFKGGDYKRYDYIFITDISVSPKTAFLINNMYILESGGMYDEKAPERPVVVLLDHHKTSEELNMYKWATVKQELNGELTSGTQLLFNYLVDNNLLDWTPLLDDFVEKVNRYDTWLWKTKYNDSTAKNLNILLSIHQKEQFLVQWVQKLLANEESSVEDAITDIDLSLIDIKQQRDQKYIQNALERPYFYNIKGYDVAVVFAEMNKSELGNELCEKYRHIDFAAVVDTKQGSISYRTIKDNVDLSKIAKMYGGGGHPKAAGSPIENANINNFLFDIFFKREDTYVEKKV